MDIANIQRGLTSWLENISGHRAVMENAPRPALIRQRGFWIVTPPDRITQQGEDYAQVVDGVETVIGRRGFVCIIKYVCRDQNPDKNARYWMEQARMSLKRTLVLEHMRTYGLAIRGLAPTVSYDAPHDGRIESIAAAELMLTCGVRDTDGSEDIGYIETVEVSAELPENPLLDYTDTIGPVE